MPVDIFQVIYMPDMILSHRFIPPFGTIVAGKKADCKHKKKDESRPSSIPFKLQRSNRLVLFETRSGISLVWLCALSPSAKLACGFLGFTQTHKGAALDPRRAFSPFESRSAAPWSGFVLFRFQ